MKNTKVSKVMLSTILGATIFLGAIAISAEVQAPNLQDTNLEKGKTQIELPSSAYVFPTHTTKQQQLEEIKAEGKRLQFEREEAERQRLAKIEAERKAKEEAERKAREEAEIARQKAIEEERKKQEQQVKGVSFNGSYYTSRCNGCTGKTATGYDVLNTIYVDGMRVIAVDPNVIALHSIVQVTTPYESFKAIALDTGGSIKGHKVDILVADEATANKLGRHTVYIKVLRSGK